MERYAELAQVFPASEAQYHAYPGCMLHHSVEIVVNSLKLRLPFPRCVGSSTKDQAAQAEACAVSVVALTRWKHLRHHELLCSLDSSAPWRQSPGIGRSVEGAM
ncbi:TraI domain-containing protein [Achromobacter sp.]|uniref:TraI domain-containing protein n=1 Tax=Achromobacter sp. TaxID=134375 RepID=UPI00257F2553|nr:TraI domain-containing protein [Achromobacter sp.]